MNRLVVPIQMKRILEINGAVRRRRIEQQGFSPGNEHAVTPMHLCANAAHIDDAVPSESTESPSVGEKTSPGVISHTSFKIIRAKLKHTSTISEFQVVVARARADSARHGIGMG